MADFSVVYDPMLDKERAEFDNGGSGGSGGSSYVGGERINIAGGTISFVNSADIVNVTGTSVTLQPDTAYKIYATSQAITLNANPPAAGKWAYDGHLEIFIAGTGYVMTGSNVVLANALEPDSVNNCTVRFHDGIAIIAVEDHIAGYIVVNGSTAGDGSLYYGISTSTNDYVAFDASLNGTTIPLAGATAEGEKHIVGNGYTETAITGAVDCGTSKFTVANLSLDDVQVAGGTMTLGDAYIPSGSTVAVSGGGLAVEKVTGDGGTIDLGGTHISNGNYAKYSVSGCIITGGNGGYEGGAFVVGTGSTAKLYDCVVSGNSASRGGAFSVYHYSTLTLTSCTVSGNSASNGAGAYLYGYSTLNLEDGTSVSNWMTTEQNASIRVNGNVKFTNAIIGSGSVTLTSGSILDLTGNTSVTPIAPGGGITFEQGGATVLTGATAGVVDAQYSMDNVTLPAGAKLTNTTVVDLGGSSHIYVGGGGIKTVLVSGCTITNGSATVGGGMQVVSAASVLLKDCAFLGNSAPTGGAVYVISSPVVTSNAQFSADVYDDGVSTFTIYGSFTLATNARLIVSGNETRIMNGAILDFTGNARTSPILYGGIVEGGCQVITSAGATVSLAGGTYSAINNDGTGTPVE